ncbi:hypothetical protein RJT34_21830 [Clitoria ternatea]|uniref:Uncharacterized protein n=1 Tax=Clitoria ternatea TaxID=43366 RepID=A0AAN9P6D2_CLITE
MLPIGVAEQVVHMPLSRNCNEDALVGAHDPSGLVYIGAILVCKLLQMRGVEVDILCVMCWKNPETISHVILKYEMARLVWFVSPIIVQNYPKRSLGVECKSIPRGGMECRVNADKGARIILEGSGA